jgi:glycine cleavage system aminomethyltransferase T
VTPGTIAGVPVDISRTGYTGDLGYEIWMPWDARSRSGTR